MKKILRSFSLFALTLTFTLTATAQSHHLTAEQAMQRVGLECPNESHLRQAKAPASNSLYYIFNTENGFIIASADDRARAVLGRSDEGQWEPDNIPPAMQGWLENMNEALQRLAEVDEPSASAEDGAQRHGAPARAAASRVEPLLNLPGEGNIIWGQNTPYNNLCPASGQTHSATGCAATAMAQIMRYYKYPEHGFGQNSYSTSTIGGEISVDFSQTRYDWDNMLTAYYLTADGKPSNYGDQQAEAVATLMYQIGAASDMDYNTGASGTTESPMLKAMVENFNYDRGLQIYYRENYTSGEWYELLQREIDAQRPVLMNGYSISGGHAFVIDGYDTTMGSGYFHFNWGWNGMSNGYYSVDIADPGQQGTGGSLGGYSYNQNIFTGIQPDAGGKAQPNLCVSAAPRYEYGQLHYQWLNRGCGSFTGQTGYVVEDGSQKTFYKVADAVSVAFRSGSGSVHQPIAPPTKAGLRYYLASAPLRANAASFTPMRPMIGAAAVLVSVEDGMGGYTLVPETAGLAGLEVEDISIEGKAYAGTTINFNVRLTNNGAEEYNGALYLSMTDIVDGQEGYEDRASDNPLGIYLRPGETGTYSFPYYGNLPVGKFLVRVLYNPRNGSGLQYLSGGLTFDVVPYGSQDVEKNPPVITISKQSIENTSIEQGSELTVNATLYNKGGTDPVNVGAAIFAEKGNQVIATLGVSSKSIAKEMSDHTFSGTIDLAPGRYRLLLGYEEDGMWEYFGWTYLYFTVTEPATDPDPEGKLPEYDDDDVEYCDQDYDGDIDTSDLGYLVQDVLDGASAKDFPWDDLNHDNQISIADVVRFIYIMNSEAAKKAEK